ncbi:MAG: tyrosine-type recombinase/integrase [Anaerolineae bacterium]|nr:tyrosine-type recombinase/integrase [Anaerolineae bacterium]
MHLLAVRDAAILKLLLLAGLRVGELIRLQLDDLVLDDRRGSLMVREGGGKKRRVVPLNAQARRGLQVYLRLRPETEAGQVFIGQRGKSIRSKTVQRADRICPTCLPAFARLFSRIIEVHRHKHCQSRG